jgi:hypothetical protein
MGFPLLQKSVEMCEDRQIQVLGSYWTGCMSNEEANSLYKCTVREYHALYKPVGCRWFTLSNNGTEGDGCGWTGQPRNCHGVSWYIATVSGKIPVFGIRGISGDIPEETKRDRPDIEHNERMIQ